MYTIHEPDHQQRLLYNVLQGTCSFQGASVSPQGWSDNTQSMKESRGRKRSDWWGDNNCHRERLWKHSSLWKRIYFLKGYTLKQTLNMHFIWLQLTFRCASFLSSSLEPFIYSLPCAVLPWVRPALFKDSLCSRSSPTSPLCLAPVPKVSSIIAH